MINLVGEILSPIETSNDSFCTNISVKRKSGNVDTLPLYIPFSAKGSDTTNYNVPVSVKGLIKSYNQDGHLFLFIDAFEVNNSKPGSTNDVVLDGFVCKKPISRYTPLGHYITEIILAINDKNSSSFIPCIIWNKKNNNVKQGDHILLTGRFQSRTYKKADAIKTAYEVSASSVKILL